MNITSTQPRSTYDIVSGKAHAIEQSILNEIDGIMKLMKPRLDAYKDVRSAWSQGNSNVWPSVSFKGSPTIHPIDSLDPSPEVNHQLSELVGSVCLRDHSKSSVDYVLATLTLDEVDTIRQLSILSEESLEKAALKLIFSLHQNNPTQFMELVQKVGTQLMHENGNTPLQLAKFNALVYDVPKLLQHQNPSFEGTPFVYFNNYKEIVDAELQLLLNTAPGQSGPVLTREDLPHQRFAFVGAGFPLTAIILHIKTGASITLVDIDSQAVDNGRNLIDICEDLGIIRKNALKVVHANAEDCLFHNTKDGPLDVPTKISVPVTILDLASALPTDTTRHVINNCTRGEVIIRKRNVDGMSQLLYSKYSHDQSESNYKLAAIVTPPHYPHDPETQGLVVGNAGRINVNSCHLLLKK